MTELANLTQGLTGVLPYSAAAELASPTMARLLQLDALYLTPAFSRFISLYANLALAMVDSNASFLHVFLAAFVSTLFLFMLFVFLPQITATNREIVQKRGLLLLVPGEVVYGSVALKTFVDDIFSADSGIVGGVPAPSRARRRHGGSVAPV